MPVGTLVTALALALTAPTARADESPAAAEAEIRVILAESGPSHMDPALRTLARYLKNSFGARYQSFRQLQRARIALPRGRRSMRRLPNDTELALTFLGTADGRLRLRMEVAGLKTIVRIHDGGLFFQAGRRYHKGMLVVAIRVRARP